MKKLKVFLVLCVLYTSAFSQEQFAYHNLVRPDQGENNVETMVKGNVVLGVPFLYADWLPGRIVLANGQAYNNYKIRYNTFEQVVMFLNQEQSMDVTDPVSEFTLTHLGEEKTFLNANLYEKSQNTAYYELMVNGGKGQLLKGHRKIIASDIQFTTINRFHAQQSYYYYDAASQKPVKLKNKAKLAKLLQLSQAEQDALKLESYDFSTEDNLVKFFKAHFAYTGP